MADITYALQAFGLNDPRASEEILPLVYNDLRRHAGMQMARESGGQTLQPTALVHEAAAASNAGRIARISSAPRRKRCGAS